MKGLRVVIRLKKYYIYSNAWLQIGTLSRPNLGLNTSFSVGKIVAYIAVWCTMGEPGVIPIFFYDQLHYTVC